MYKLNILLHLFYFATIASYADETVKSFCELRDNSFDIRYNFTKLNEHAKDIIITHEYPNETIRMQLCSPLKEKCNGKDGYGICLIRSKEEKGIGKMPPKVMIESGRIMFVFTGDKCTETSAYIVNVFMKCDYSAEKYSLPELFSHTDEQCTLFMIWRTSLACRERIQQECTLIDKGYHYDLSPLTKYSENYVISTGTKPSAKIILNVCHSVIFQYNALCQMDSGACLQEPTSTSQFKYTNLGNVQKSISMDDGKIKIEYEYGDMCMKNIAQPHIKTTITFICDYEAMDTIPVYVGGSEECHYQLTWRTIAACTVESLRDRVSTADKCTVTNPLTNFQYNLQSLMNKDFYVRSKSGGDYKFGVCGPTITAACKVGTGICLTNNHTSMGSANTKLLWQVGGPYLNYTNGDTCETGQHRHTIIGFVCGPEGSPDKPLVMEEYPCQLIINWYTDLVCEKRVKCATNDNDIDLTPLIRSTSNYVVKMNSSEFHINICRPLVAVPGVTCAHGSAVCKAFLTKNNETVNETSLGFALESPIVNKEGQAVLQYQSGSPCPENPDRSISSNFTFPCGAGNKGLPEYKKYEDCTYVFEWKTSITCGAVMGNWIPPCTIRDQLFSRECDLSLLHKEKQIHFVKNKQGKEYAISICGTKDCGGSSICQGANGYGSQANVIFDHSRDVIKLQYTNGSKCLNSSYTSEIRFICNESGGIGAPKLLWELQCSTEFEWYTNVTCSCQSGSQTASISSGKYESSEHSFPSHAVMVAGVVLIVVGLLAALFYFREPTKRVCLHSCRNPFVSRRGSGRVQYCRVNTTEEARLLLDADPTQCQTDSDDDLINA